jgi:hypothetical protein
MYKVLKVHLILRATDIIELLCHGHFQILSNLSLTHHLGIHRYVVLDSGKGKGKGSPYNRPRRPRG